jgi:hypothetical protein
MGTRTVSSCNAIAGSEEAAMTTDTMQITVIGELDRVPNIAGIIQASICMYEGTGHEGFGELFFEGLHISWTCSSHERVVKLPKRRKKAAA